MFRYKFPIDPSCFVGLDPMVELLKRLQCQHESSQELCQEVEHAAMSNKVAPAETAFSFHRSRQNQQLGFRDRIILLA